MSEETRRRDWEDNHILISEQYIKLARKWTKRPTVSALVKATKLSHATIETHLLEMSKMNLEDRYKHFKFLTGDLLLSMYREGKKGKASCAKLFLQIIEDFTEKKEHKIPGLEALNTEELKAKMAELTIEESENDDEDSAEADEN